jgi:hypothetical protein
MRLSVSVCAVLFTTACGGRATSPSIGGPTSDDRAAPTPGATGSVPPEPATSDGIADGGCDRPAPTISRGIAGLVYDGCDTPDCTGGPSSWWSVGVFAALPPLGPIDSPLAVGKPDSRGYYEIALEPGSYVVCAGHLEGGGIRVYGVCIDVTIGGGVSGFDYTSGPGGGAWFAGGSDCRVGGVRLPDATGSQDVSTGCSYPSANNDPRCPPSYSHAYQGESCSPVGLTCSYPGAGDGTSNGCFATAMMLCHGDGGIGDLGDSGADAGSGSWTTAQ